MAEEAGLEPASDERDSFQDYCPNRLGISSASKMVRCEAKTFALCSLLEIKIGRHAPILFGELRFWRLTFCQLKLRASGNFGVSDGT